MKKQFLTIICAAFAVLMVSCGGSKSGSAEGAAAGEETAEAAEFSGETYSKDAVEFYLKNFKLKFSDVEPGFAYDDSDSKNFKGEARDVIAGFPTKGDKELSAEEYKEFVTKVYNATKAVSENHICMYGFEKKSKKEEAMAEQTLDAVMKGDSPVAGFHTDAVSWTYMVDGQLMIVDINRLSDKEGCYVRVSVALQKSMDETLDDAEKAIEEIDKDPNKKAIVDKALKDAGVK